MGSNGFINPKVVSSNIYVNGNWLSPVVSKSILDTCILVLNLLTTLQKQVHSSYKAELNHFWVLIYFKDY